MTEQIRVTVSYPESLSLVRKDGEKDHYCAYIRIDPKVDYGHDIRETLEGVLQLYRLSIAKGFFYGSSWKKRGMVRSWISNIDRKYDRMDSCVAKGLFGVDLMECIADLTVYSFLGLFNLFSAKDKKEFKHKEIEEFVNRYNALLDKSDSPEVCENPPSEVPSVQG